MTTKALHISTPQLIVALDVPNADNLPHIIGSLPSAITYFKVGLELFIADGPKALALLNEAGKKIFLDLKLHDIPNTVERAVRAAARHKVAMLTLHAAGGSAMLSAAVKAAEEYEADAPLLLAVTTLTSLDSPDLLDIGVTRPLQEHTLELAALAQRAGVKGIVASVLETQVLRQRLGESLQIVTPGIRPAGPVGDDQRRTATPADAKRFGSSFIVVGRPILNSSNPAAAALSILRELDQE